MTPALSTQVLHKDANGPPMMTDFHYCSIIGKLDILEKSMHLDIAYAIHQCARFSQHPKHSHAEAIKQIWRYVKAIKELRLILVPDHYKSFDCWVDANFS